MFAEGILKPLELGATDCDCNKQIPLTQMFNKTGRLDKKKQSGKRISSSFPTSSYCGLYWLNTMAIVDESVTNGRTQFAIIPDSFSYVAQVKMVIADGT